MNQRRCFTCSRDIVLREDAELEVRRARVAVGGLHRQVRTLEARNANLLQQVAVLSSSLAMRGNAPPSMPVRIWKVLVSLAHPDRDSGVPGSDDAIRWLTENRP